MKPGTAPKRLGLLSDLTSLRKNMPTARRTLILTESDVARLIDMRAAIRIVRRALAYQARGQVLMPSKVYLTLPDGSDFRAMPAAISELSCGQMLPL